MNERVAVIIPYFQRQPGLLTRAIESIFNQRPVVCPRIIVIDDGSPLPAQEDLAALDPVHRQAVHLICQPNGGVAHARNTGLNAVPDDTAYVAFLDPDDVWMEDHIDQALTAMRLGFDFYFADCRRHDETTGYFSRTGLVPAEHISTAPERNLYAVRGDFFDRLLRHSPIGTGTVVMRRRRLGHLRFSESIRPAGEDLLFWLDAARATTNAAFSYRINMICGEGINLSVAQDWASTKSMNLAKGYGDFYAEVRHRFPLTLEQDRFVQQRIHNLRQSFMLAALGMLRRRQRPDFRLLFSFLCRNPAIILYGPRVLAARLVGW